ncbi:MAG TPA: hypothetical protein VMF65_05960 [Acidimicrobiales bacterium]|nr:hypothetical protein [Acidimicrobiales bacterium]
MWADHSISSWPDREALVVAVVRALGLAELACSKAAMRQAILHKTSAG